MFASNKKKLMNSNWTNDPDNAKKLRKYRMNEPIKINTEHKAAKFLERFDTILCDCDGVLWLNNEAIPGSPQVLNKLREMGKKIIFATNNSTKTRKGFQDKLVKLGFECHESELFPTSLSTALYLKSIRFDKKVFVIGSPGLAEELNSHGIRTTGIGEDITPKHWTPGMADVDLDDKVGAVVVGFDNQISFPKLVKACSYVKRPDVLFIASNSDESYPSPLDKPDVIVPGPGAYVAAITAVTGVKPIVLGKPFKRFFNIIQSEHPNIHLKRTVMIGDRLTTDMVFGRNNGIKTLFVQSGISTLDDMINYMNSSDSNDHLCVPDYYLDSLGDLNKFI